MARLTRQRATPTAAEGRLHARPIAPADLATPTDPPTPGLQPLGLGTDRDGLLFVPTGYRPDQPAPLVVMLHGAGGIARHGIDPFLALAEGAGLILLAPDSRGRTWDVILGAYGPDVAFIDRALDHVFAHYAIDPARVAAEGFSDGASYALSLGLTNGDLFRHLIAFSPGFAAPADQQGEPRLFVSHGIHDTVLPIDVCSRRLVPPLKRAGYDVTYHEFDGPHTVPSDIAQQALTWFLTDAPTLSASPHSATPTG